MKLYDIVTADGEFVDSMSRIEILERFGISKGVFQRYLDNGDLLEGKYQINDYDCDIKARKCKDRELFLQFDILTQKIRGLSDGKVKNKAEKESIHSVYESAGSYVRTVYPELSERVKRDGIESL